LRAWRKKTWLHGDGQGISAQAAVTQRVTLASGSRKFLSVLQAHRDGVLKLCTRSHNEPLQR
jgi:hypothetical protein